MISWKFKEGSILSFPSNSKCEDIFSDFCEELGRFFSDDGGKYAKSGPHITFIKNNIKLKLCFWSSRSNTPGESVALEIIPNFYSSDVEFKKGYFWGHPAVFNIGDKKIKNRFNIYGVTEKEFLEIAGMIKSKILPVLEIFANVDSTIDYLASVSEKYKNSSIHANQGLEQYLNKHNKLAYEIYFGEKNA